MAGIYIHIPFCKQKCHYCNFYTTGSLKYRKDFVRAIKLEVRSRKNYLKPNKITTVYFGGGTPSMLSVNELNDIMGVIYEVYDVVPGSEITLESNPDDINYEYLNDLKKNSPINRLSIGIQSFFDDDLEYLHRVHDSRGAKKSIENSLKAGFKNITIDLIYGIPTLTNDKWVKNINLFFDYNLPHLSSYSLTVEKKTALDVLIRNQKLANIDEKQSIEHFNTLIELTENRSYVNYEISNFAKRGYYSKHNSIYWLGGHYIGLGPSAHSYNGVSRQWNVMNMKKYCENDPAHIIAEKEVLSKNQMYNEYVLTSLRTSWGSDTEHILNMFGADYSNHFIRTILPFIENGKIAQKGSVYKLTTSGKLFADGIASSLFFGF
ncbi:MAG: coproporphyrinogen III oxidase [Lentimicrobiaceae bacterium]|nr:coproporphyrinogen III oxidase [Lentimicrobiaceae bacterium]